MGTEERVETGAAGEFISTDQNLRLVIEPTRPRLDPSGVVVQVPGRTIEFRAGQYEAKSSEEVSFLRDHEQFNRLFFERGNEPRRVEDPSTVLEEIVEATVAGDISRLEEIYLEERASLSRDPVLKAAAKGIEKLDGLDAVPAAPPTPVHEVERLRDESIQTPAGSATEAQLAGEVDNQGDPIEELEEPVSEVEEGAEPPADDRG